MGAMTPDNETFSGRTVGFTIPSRNARGRVVRIDDVLDEILSAHDYPPSITALLAEALVVTALVGSLLKDDGSQLTLQAQTEAGAIALLVCDYRGGELRGYVDFDEAALAGLGANPTLFALFGKGFLALTFDTKGKGRYQGIVPLEGDSLASACEAYFAQSEQVPTLIRTAIAKDENGCRAAGILVQHLPDGEEGRERLHVRLDHPEWEHVAVMAGSIKHEELVDTSLSLESIVWRLFHEEDQVRSTLGAKIERGCRCSADHYRMVLEKFPETERASMRNDDGVIEVDCAFCSRIFPIAM